jgi:ribosome-binding factor A
MSHRIGRFSSTLKQNLADIIINDINNPHLKSVSITEVIVSPDLKKARVYVSCTIGGDPKGGHDIDDLIRQLTRARGFIRKSLTQRMYLKYVPELFFISNSDEILYSIG